MLLNTSLTEGQSGAILEAMALGVPVVARANEGNASLVTHGASGLLFHTPAEAVACCAELLEQPARRAALVAGARAACAASHGLHAERAAWRRVLSDLGLPLPLRGGPQPQAPGATGGDRGAQAAAAGAAAATAVAAGIGAD